MAEIKSGILGNVRGAVGKITGRIYKGRNIISQRPEFRRISTSPGVITHKNNFKLCVKFSSAACSMDAIKAAWQMNLSPEMNYFNYFIQTNIKLVSEGMLTVNNIITPYSGFAISKASNAIAPAEISIGLSALSGSYNFDTAVEVKAKLYAVLYLYGSSNPQAPEYFLMPVEFDTQALQLNDPLSFTKAFLLTDQTVIGGYANRKVYAALITFDANDVPVNFSATLCIE